jgi:hypothetical protein
VADLLLLRRLRVDEHVYAFLQELLASARPVLPEGLINDWKLLMN